MKKKSSKVIKFALNSLLCTVILLNSFSFGRAEAQEDPAARELLNIILTYQPNPYGLPNPTFSYTWAQFMMSIVAAEQNGYIGRAEAIDRLSGILSVVANLDKYYGFTYDRYDPVTLRPTTKKVNFQGWYLYSLIVIKNTYPELAAACQNLLNGIDYYNSGMYNQSQKSLAQGYIVGQGPTFYWSLADYAGSEIRIGYLAYTYITGDKSPWLLNREPTLETVEGYSLLNIWHSFNYDAVLLHNQLPEYGYYKRSWDNLLPATTEYMNDNGMVLFPIRQEPLNLWPGRPSWPNTEHREAMPWLTWYIDPNAPVMSKAFIPGYGISRYYDNWNFYWTYGNNMFVHPSKIGTAGSISNGYFIFPFFVYPPADAVNPTNPPVLKSISFTASYDAGKIPNDNLIIEVNGNKIGEISPMALSTSPTPVTITNINVPLFNGGNYLTLRNADPTAGYTYNLYSHENDYRFVKFRYPAANSIIDYLDTFDDLEPSSDEDARIMLSYVSGIDGRNAMNMAYSFKTEGFWAQIGKDCSDIDISSGSAVQFYFCGRGNPAGLEVKLEDLDGTIYGYRFNSLNYNLPWTFLSIPYSDFHYYWGGKDTILDVRHIKNIWFTALKTADGSIGNFYIDNVGINGDIGARTELVPGAVMEIIVDGQRAEQENGMAFLSRVAVAHNYHVYTNLLKDPRFIDSLVGWVGGYDNHVSLAPYIHNLGNTTVGVSYERPDSWKNNSSIRITDITTSTDVTDTATFGTGVINWPAISHHTYKIEHLTGGISGKVTLQGRANHSALINFEIRNPGQVVPISTYQVTTAADGTYTISDIEIGTYDLTAKNAIFLRAKQANITVTAGQTISNINFNLLGGDANNDNSVAITDKAILASAWNTKSGDPKYDARADFNGDGSISIGDKAILASNWLKRGAD